MANNNSGPGVGTAVGVGAGVAALAAAGAAAYWLFGSKHSAKHRKMAKSWMLKARAEVLDAVETVQDLDKEKYLAIAEDTLKKYGERANASAEEMSAMMKDFRSAWSHMQGAQKKVTKKRPAKKRKA